MLPSSAEVVGTGRRLDLHGTRFYGKSFRPNPIGAMISQPRLRPRRRPQPLYTTCATPIASSAPQAKLLLTAVDVQQRFTAYRLVFF
jgi:hypothetical protein